MIAGKIGTKKMRKLQAKAEKKAMREVNDGLILIFENHCKRLLLLLLARRGFERR